MSQTEQLQATQQAFLSTPHFAVIGASKDLTKYGSKVLKWYKDRSLDVVPIHPTAESLEDITALKAITELPNPKETALSIITRPSITIDLLKTASSLGISSVWLQPGAEDESVIEYLQTGAIKNAIYGGPCILVEGDGIRSML